MNWKNKFIGGNDGDDDDDAHSAENRDEAKQKKTPTISFEMWCWPDFYHIFSSFVVSRELN